MNEKNTRWSDGWDRPNLDDENGVYAMVSSNVFDLNMLLWTFDTLFNTNLNLTSQGSSIYFFSLYSKILVEIVWVEPNQPTEAGIYIKVGRNFINFSKK